MTEAVNAITKEIEKHRTRLVELEEQMKSLETELPQVRTNLEALTRALSIIQGKPTESVPEGPKEEKPISLDKNRGLREGSQAALARSILKEANSSLSMDELFNRASGKKPGISHNSFTSGIYGHAQNKRYFKIKSGKVSLLE